MSNENRSISESIDSQLRALARDDIANGIKIKFQEDSDRALTFSYQHQELYLDFSKTHISKPLIDLYLDLAHEQNFEDRRLAFLAGQKINNSEDRAVLHLSLIHI